MLLDLGISMSTNQQFQKSPATPADSELWKIGKKWRTSAKGIDYTELDNIMSTDPEIEIESLLEALNEQLAGKVQESIQYVGHYLVASHTPDGKAFVYGFPPNRKDEAEKKASYNKGYNTGSVPAPRQQQTFRPQQSNTSTSSTVQVPLQQSKPSFTTPTLEVPYNIRPIEWDNAMEIEQAEKEGLYILPVKHVGVENWGFVNENGRRTFYYGRIKTVTID